MKKDPYITTGHIWVIDILIKGQTPCIALVIHESRNLMQARPKHYFLISVGRCVDLPRVNNTLATPSQGNLVL